ncbi:MAG: gliding motility-associated C-terminal domain-containing protein, partial [Bacteroidota bacterium]
SVQGPICFTDAVGSIIIDTLFGGKPPYQYRLDGEELVPIVSSPLIINNIAPGAYTLSIEDAQGCFEMVEVEIEAPQELQVELGDDQTILLGASVDLQVISNFTPTQFQWTSDLDGAILWEEGFLEITPAETTVYTVIATDENGCQVEDRVTIFVNRERQVYIPNGFSPNDDGQNDRFTIFSGPDVVEVQSLRVFDRWGEMVYEATNIGANDEPNGWDGTFRGKDLNSGVFIYVAEIRFVDGITEVFKGDVSLLR